MSSISPRGECCAIKNDVLNNIIVQEVLQVDVRVNAAKALVSKPLHLYRGPIYLSGRQGATLTDDELYLHNASF